MAQVGKYARIITIVKYIVVWGGALISLFPIYVMITTSFKIRADAFSIPPKWFFTPTLKNYIHVLFSQNFFTYFVNSVIVALTSTVLSVMLGALAGYALARFKFMGKA